MLSILKQPNTVFHSCAFLNSFAKSKVRKAASSRDERTRANGSLGFSIVLSISDRLRRSKGYLHSSLGVPNQHFETVTP
ncbi:unnamed protein product [Linum trigynum]|uniref:Uncharacterized protein n=1 Tax=Linum trigynum TaxID=586398 RepID=A0AAV2DP90_9ROSI